MKKLSIIIPQYKEDYSVIRGALDSIGLQRGINFDELEVIIVNDCSQWELGKSIAKKYNYEIKFLRTPKNAGAGVARQYGIDRAKGKYLMFLDADDMLCSAISIRGIMNYKGKADLIVGRFFNEAGNKNDNGLTWVHGKFFKRSYLQKRNIRFADDIRVNEDSCFCLIARQLTKNVEEWEDVVTFWATNPNSITRENRSKFVVTSYGDFLKGKLWALRRLKQEQKDFEIKYTLMNTFCYTYYYLQQKEYRDAKNKAYKKKYEIQLMQIVKEFWKWFAQIGEEDFNRHLLETIKSFLEYEQYKLCETFDKWRKKLYSYEI